MDSKIVAAIIASIVAFFAAIISLVIGLKSQKLQKKLGNSAFQIEYLKNRFTLLNSLKIELLSLDFGNESNEKMTEDGTLIIAMANYMSKLLTKVPEIIDKLKGHIDNDKLAKIEDKINTIRKYKASASYEFHLGNLKNNMPPVDINGHHPTIFLLNTYEELKRFIVEEMTTCRNQIEKIIEIDIR